MGEFEKGKTLFTEAGEPIVVESLLGEGGQGYVYKVDFKGKKKALKWYKPNALRDPIKFYDNLKRNSEKDSPDKSFLWPQAITQKSENSFGYVMDLRPVGYYEFTKYMNAAKHFKSYKATVQACLKIVKAFRILHNAGYSYQDINAGNFFIKPENGDVLICDNDNVAPNKTDIFILGTPMFMAPEIVMGKAKPSTETDRYSLALVLFTLLFNDHPLHGRQWGALACESPNNEKLLYGQEALFMFDPHDHSNAAYDKVNKNAVLIWSCLPKYMREAFQTAFSREALIDNPQKRTREIDWINLFVRFQSDIVRCDKCNNEVFMKNYSGTACDNCGKPVRIQNTILLKTLDYEIPAVKGTKIYRCQLGICNPDVALDPIGMVQPDEDDSSRYWLTNYSSWIWEVTTTKGKRVLIEPDDSVPVRAGLEVKINGSIIEIK